MDKHLVTVLNSTEYDSSEALYANISSLYHKLIQPKIIFVESIITLILHPSWSESMVELVSWSISDVIL